ncbi:MAG: DMT family transporter [Acidobacteriota bacterium]|nr:DMT family transporter [Acidobacteriota bacterium]
MIHLAIVAGVLAISFSAIFVRLAGVSPDTSAFFRTFYALPALLVLWLALGSRRASPRLVGLALASGLAFGLDLVFWHRAIQWIGAGLATVLGNIQVVLVGLAAWLLYGERPRNTVFAGVALAFAGMILVSGLGRPEAYGDDPPRGALFGLLTAIMYTLFLLLLRRSTRDEATPFGAFFLSTLAATLTIGAIGGLGGSLELAWSWPAHGWLLALALGSQVAGWLLISYALPRLPAVESSVLLLLQPAATLLWAFLVFGEDLSALQWLGVLAVMTGVALPALGGARQRRRAKEIGPSRI